MANTQDHLTITDIKEGTLILKDGSMSMIIQTSAVNFGLLSEMEQLSIISSFAGLLNSLSFPIQIVIRSKKLDISTYLKGLDSAQAKQTNPLLYSMIGRYKAFIQNTVAENEVLDKQFYICLNVSGVELGLMKKIDDSLKKGLTLLIPRRDHIMRQLGRIGLKADQLSNAELLKLFFDIYNPSPAQMIKNSEVNQSVILGSTSTSLSTTPGSDSGPARMTTPAPPPAPVKSAVQFSQPTPVPATTPTPTQTAPVRKRAPFIVEELPEDFSHV